MRMGALLVSGVALALAGCGGSNQGGTAASESAATPAAETAPAAAPTEAAAPAAPATPEAAPVAFASLTGDAAKGQQVFNQCKVCHSIEAGKNLIGPSLHGVVGREAGTVAGFAYSPGNKNSHITWDKETIFTYLAAPARMVPGTKMTFMLADPQARADVIAYLDTLK